jgi:hypothetical protein
METGRGKTPRGYPGLLERWLILAPTGRDDDTPARTARGISVPAMLTTSVLITAPAR